MARFIPQEHVSLRHYWREWRERLSATDLERIEPCAIRLPSVERTAAEEFAKESDLAWYAAQKGALMFIPQKRVDLIAQHVGCMSETLLYAFFTREGRMLASVVGYAAAIKWAVNEAEREALLAVVGPGSARTSPLGRL